MSDQQGGAGPVDPYGTPGQGQGGQPSYGQPEYEQPQSGYGQPPYGYQPAPAYGAPPAGYGPPPLPAGTSYASWGQRAVALILDVLLVVAFTIPAVIVAVIAASTTDSGEGLTAAFVALIVILSIAAFLAGLWNICWRQGATGQSYGKQAMGITLVKEIDFRPLGGGMGIVRFLMRWTLG